jgi:polar amino acid transport system substrate-binding protein
MKLNAWKRTGVAATAAVAVLGLAACGSSSSGGGTASTSPSSSGAAVSKDATLAAMVPSSISGKGTLVIGSDASYAPSEFLDTDGKTIIGFDADLAKALAEVLGLKADMQNAPFDSLILSVQNGKYDLGVSSFTINADREKQVDMVSYFNAGTSWAVEKGNPAGITPDNACGKKVAVQKGTVQVDDITARSKTCTDAGKPAITIDQYQLQSDATAAVATGKDDAMLADSPVVAYAVKQTGDKLEVTGQTYDAAPYGIAVPKNQGQFTQAIQGAMQKLMDTGVYLDILKKWGVESGAVTQAQINPVS